MSAAPSTVIARLDRSPDEAEFAAIAPVSRRADAAAIRVEIASPERYRGLDAAWTDLARRAAEPNAFMDPVAIATAAKGAAAADYPVLLAWDGARLAGVWALRKGRPRSGLPVPILVTPIHESWSDSTPVLDAAQPGPVLAAMLDAIERAPDLPKVIGIELMDDAGPVMDALLAALAARGSAPVVLGRDRRPKLVCGESPDAYFAKAMSGSRRRKLGQLRRKLAGRGTLDLTIHTGEAAVAAGIERFMELEAAGWKGQLGRPLLNIPDFRDYVRAALPALAACKRAEIWDMTLDAEPVSMAVILRSGSRVYDWKIAYDERHGDCSPGVLLAQDYTSAFLRDPALTIGDSCAQNDTGLLGALWTERQPMANLMIDCRRGGSMAFALSSTVERGYRGARRLAKGPFHALKARLRRALRPAPAKGAAGS